MSARLLYAQAESLPSLLNPSTTPLTFPTSPISRGSIRAKNRATRVGTLDAPCFADSGSWRQACSHGRWWARRARRPCRRLAGQWSAGAGPCRQKGARLPGRARSALEAARDVSSVECSKRKASNRRTLLHIDGFKSTHDGTQPKHHGREAKRVLELIIRAEWRIPQLPKAHFITPHQGQNTIQRAVGGIQRGLTRDRRRNHPLVIAHLYQEGDASPASYLSRTPMCKLWRTRILSFIEATKPDGLQHLGLQKQYRKNPHIHTLK